VESRIARGLVHGVALAVRRGLLALDEVDVAATLRLVPAGVRAGLDPVRPPRRSPLARPDAEQGEAGQRQHGRPALPSPDRPDRPRERRGAREKRQ
jgi:hypothetical protein